MRGPEGIFLRSERSFIFRGLDKGWYFATEEDWKEFNSETLWEVIGSEGLSTQTLKVPMEYLT